MQGFARYRAMLVERKGPLPVWGWIVLILAVLLGWSWWRRNKSAAAQNEALTGSASDSFANGGAPSVFLLQQPATVPQVNVHVDPAATTPTSPPGAGGSSPTGSANTLSAPDQSVNLYDWVKQINASYGTSVSFVDLFGTDKNPDSGLNPGYRKYIRWRPSSAGPVPYFEPNWSGRTPPLGIPPVRIR